MFLTKLKKINRLLSLIACAAFVSLITYDLNYPVKNDSDPKPQPNKDDMPKSALVMENKLENIYESLDNWKFYDRVRNNGNF